MVLPGGVRLRLQCRLSPVVEMLPQVQQLATPRPTAARPPGSRQHGGGSPSSPHNSESIMKYSIPMVPLHTPSITQSMSAHSSTARALHCFMTGSV